MDAKSAAKSKRAHSLHNKPKKPHPAPAPATAVAGKQKAPPPTSRRRPPPSLPTNWDRYDDEVPEEDGGGGGGDGDAVRPRSKGADFGFLVSEAENELRNRRAGGGEEDVAFDFDLGLGTIFHSYGKNLTSLNSDDNFIVNDHASSHYEENFLSIDLDALADCLAKLDPSERLFIEEDRLPEELRKVQVSSSHGRDVKQDTQACAELGISKGEEFNDNAEITSSSTYVETTLVEGTSELAITGQVPTIEDSVITDETNKRNVADYPRQTVGFEATAAEAELDSLLDSSGETQFSESFRAIGKANYLVITDETNKRKVADYPRQTVGFEATAAEAELDSLLDSSGETQFSESFRAIGKANYNSLGNAPNKDDGFFSKNTAVSSSDVSVDDLLNEVPDLQQPRLTSFLKLESSGYLNSSSTVPKTLDDDIDSWLDSI